MNAQKATMQVIRGVKAARVRGLAFAPLNQLLRSQLIDQADLSNPHVATGYAEVALCVLI